jgi:hypothetical protein
MIALADRIIGTPAGVSFQMAVSAKKYREWLNDRTFAELADSGLTQPVKQLAAIREPAGLAGAAASNEKI